MSDLMTQKEVAEMFKVHKVTIIRWQNKKGFPYRDYGGVVRYDREEVLAWDRAHRINFVSGDMPRDHKEAA